MNKIKLIINFLLKWPWLNFYFAIFFILSPFIFNSIIQGYKGEFISKIQIGLPSVSRLLAFIFTILGFVSLYKKSYVKSLYYYQSSLKDLSDIKWQDFESLISNYFIKTGFIVKERDKLLNDEFNNLEANKENYKIIINCKFWHIKNLNASLIENIYKEVESEKVDQIYIITLGNFSYRAKEFARGKNIELINGYTLIEWKNFINN